MFSTQEKREISDKVQAILKETKHPELPKDEIVFHLHVWGAESSSWADILNNGAVENPEKKQIHLMKKQRKSKRIGYKKPTCHGSE